MQAWRTGEPGLVVVRAPRTGARGAADRRVASLAPAGAAAAGKRRRTAYGSVAVIVHAWRS